MKKNILKINTSSHFIGSWNIDKMDIDKIIEYFDLSHENHKIGTIENGLIDKTKKDCIELFIKPREIEEKIRLFRLS